MDSLHRKRPALWLRRRRRDHLQARRRARLRGCCVEAVGVAIPVRPLGTLGQGQEPEGAGRHAGGRGGLAVTTRRRRFPP